MAKVRDCFLSCLLPEDDSPEAKQKAQQVQKTYSLNLLRAVDHFANPVHGTDDPTPMFRERFRVASLAEVACGASSCLACERPEDIRRCVAFRFSPRVSTTGLCNVRGLRVEGSGF